MSPTDEATDTRADGGAADTGESLFGAESEIKITRKEQYIHILDTTVLAPLRIAWTDWRARIGIIIILVYLLMGTVGVYVVEPPSLNEGPRLLGPFNSEHTRPLFGVGGVEIPVWEYPFGTNNLGEDIFAMIVHATPPMLKMISAGAVFASAMAAIVGTLSGYKGGLTDRVLMTFTDILMTIPGLPLVILLGVILEPRNPYVIGLMLTVNAWAGLARTVRSQVLTIREDAYVEASRVMGVPTSTILSQDVLPNLMPYIAVNFVQSARGVIFSSVALYFLGVLPSTQINWGLMLDTAYSSGGALYSSQAAHWLLAPMGAIVFLSLGFILIAQGTDRLFNPRVRARHAKTVTGDSDESSDGSETNAATVKGGF